MVVKVAKKIKKSNKNPAFLILSLIILTILIVLVLYSLKSSKILSINTKAAPNRIVGGDVVDVADYPFVVAIFDTTKFKFDKKNGKSNLYDVTYCTGSLISSRYVVTASHCVVEWDHKTGRFINKNLNPNSIGIALGFNNLKTDLINKDHILVFGSEIIRDPELDLPQDFKHFKKEFALIKINKTIDLNKFKSISFISNSSLSNSNSSVMTLGYGDTQYFIPNFLGLLKNITLNIKPQSSLDKPKTGLSKYDGYIIVNAYRKGIATGDSGGPLLIWKNNKWNLIGISAKVEPSQENVGEFYSYFTDISLYTNLIFYNIRVVANSGNYVGTPPSWALPTIIPN
ncbi:MAG: trypsin-like serine protease [Patescibacteria group bacterium]|jgi:hypothetical protein